MADTTTGKKIIQVLHSELRKRNPALTASLTEFNELLRRTYFPRDTSEAPAGYQMAYYPRSSPTAYAIAVDNMGSFLVEQFEIGESEITDAMSDLASKTGGNIPEKFASINGAFTGVLSEVKFFPMAAFVLAESGKEIASGVQKVGETVMAVGQSIFDIKQYILPIALGVGGLFLFLKFRGMKQS